MGKEWFASWFDSPYYPILYQHRDYAEAERFIRKLVASLDAPQGALVLDLACGRGRHARFLNQLGLNVTGLDLSPESIADANTFANEQLHFAVHDMRDPFPPSVAPSGTFDCILNLFTSFGYFADQSENLRVLRNVRTALSSPSGEFVLDFMNVPRILAGLVPEEEKQLNGIGFHIRRRVEDGFIVKDIHVKDGEKVYDFQERVQAISKPEF